MAESRTFTNSPADAHRPISGRLVIATHNPGKLREMRELLMPYGIEAVSAGDLGLAEPEETGTSFAENAEIKARAAAAASGLPAFADDSGLAVDALDGDPGIYSARWAGPQKDFRHAMTTVEDKLRARGAVSAEDVARAASFGDPLAVELLHGAGARIGSMLAGVVNFFNPDLIVIGGGVAQSGDVLLASIRETVYGRSLPLATRELAIRRSSLGGLAGVIGASAMVVDQLFSRESLARWAPAGEPSGMPEVAVAAG